VLNSSPASTVYEFGASNYLLGMRRKNLNFARYGHGSVSIKGVVYAFGGFGHKDAPGEPPKTLSSLEKLTSPANNWEMATNMNEARAFFGHCALDGQYIYVFGGFHDYDMLNTIEKYDTITDTWITLYFKLPYPMANHAAIAIDKRNILILGGMSKDYEPMASVINIDVTTAKFTKKVPLKSSKLMDGGVYLAVDNSVFVIWKHMGTEFKSERYVIRDLNS